MRNIVLFILLQTLPIASFAQNPRWKDGEAPVPARADLDVRWEALTKAIPSKVWVYRLLPNEFSPEIISNMMNLCSLTAKDKTAQSTNGMTFQSPDRSRKLSISFPSGRIDYETAEPHYGPTHLAEGVPPMSEMPKLATDVVRKAGISFSEITNPFDRGRRTEGTSKFHLSEPLRIYFVGDTPITNIEYRTVKFWRCVDRIPVNAGDGGEVTFGEHGKIRKFTIVWRNLERYQWLATVNPKTAMNFLREGKAVQGLVLDSSEWATLKRVTIKEASPLYYDGHSGWLYPFLALVATTEPTYGHTQFEIDCPIIDETKLAVPTNSP